MADALLPLTDAQFAHEVLAPTAGLVLVDFGAAWCAPCHALDPIMAQVAAERSGKLKLFKMDVDADPQASVQFGVRGLPTLLLFKGGQLVERLVGLQKKQAILAAIDKHAG